MITTVFSQRRGAGYGAFVIFLLSIGALWLANLAAFSFRPQAYRVDVGTFRDFFWLDGLYGIEVADGRSYRWTSAFATLELIGVQHSQPTLLEIHSGPRPEPVTPQLRLNGEPWTALPVGPKPRIATLLLPPHTANRLLVEMQSSTFQTADDPRNLGFILDAFAIRIIGNAPVAPSIALLLVQFGIVAGVQLVVIRLGGGWPMQILVALAIAVASAIVAMAILPLSYVYLQYLAVVAALMAGSTYLFMPLIERRLNWAGNPRQLQILWALMLIAIAIRLTGVLHPTFGGQDLGRNVDRMNLAIRGQHVIIASSSEFADGQTIYPTGPYMAVMPFLIVINNQDVAMQGVLATMDGLTTFLVGLLTLRLGGSHTAARLAMVLYAGSLTAFAVITFSFSAQIFGQWFTVPVLLLLSQPGALDQPRLWLLAIVALTFGIFSHIGVAILSIAWFGALLGLMLLFRRDSPGLRQGIVAFAGMLLAAFVLLYSHIALDTLSHLGSLFSPTGGESEAEPLFKGATILLWKGIQLAFTEIGIFLLLPALLLFFARPPSNDAVLTVGAMLLTALVFFLVDLTLYLQVRYLYFTLPLVLAIIARLLGALARSSRFGRIGVWCLCLALGIMTISLWYGSTWGDYKMTMTPLTH